jgi:hypothetical protein
MPKRKAGHQKPNDWVNNQVIPRRKGHLVKWAQNSRVVARAKKDWRTHPPYYLQHVLKQVLNMRKPLGPIPALKQKLANVLLMTDSEVAAVCRYIVGERTYRSVRAKKAKAKRARARAHARYHYHHY